MSRSPEVKAAIARLADGADDEQDLAMVLDATHDEGVAQLRGLGCTCRPVFSLSPMGLGGLGLPAWMSEHDEWCGLSVQVAAHRQASTS